MYETFFGLSGKPFQLNPDPAFLFGSRGHRRAMAYLEYGLHQGEGFIVITGEVGAGKTTLVRSLLERLNQDRVVAANLVNTQLEGDDILRVVAGAFGIPAKGRDKSDLLLAIETFLVEVTAAGKRALLFVDEAQNLSPVALEELRMLSNIQLEDHSLLQSFLVGQPEFRAVMRSPQMQQLRQRVIASYHLGPLDSEETQAYILHRLRHVGWKDDPIFFPSVFDLIHAHSGGIPRRINALCDRVLLAACIAQNHEIHDEDVQDVVDELQEEFSLQPMTAAGTESVSPLDDDVVRRADSRRLEERIDRVEQSINTALDVLNRLAEQVVPPSRPETPPQDDNSETLQ
ncbi:MAG: XrtA-associated ATPase [Azoarcus sp.]|jgi:putative secretion ATPase (PEP-CTERM system associated)|nr:XrtA-associated ATPase [Azoarcus sp.]